MNEGLRESQLKKKADEAASIRAMCQMPGFKVLQNKFDEKVKQATQRILDPNTTDDQVMSLRRRIQVWTEVSNMLIVLMRTGDYALKVLEDEKVIDDVV